MPQQLRAYQIVAAMSPELGREMLDYFRAGTAEEKQVFKAAIARVAADRKLRPVFVQRKSGTEQVEWLRTSLARRQGDDLAEHLLQVWLMNAHQDMLTAFLDANGVGHEDAGIEELPEAFDTAKLATALDDLADRFPAENLAVYLHAFQLQKPGGWDEITAELAKRPALALPGTTTS